MAYMPDPIIVEFTDWKKGTLYPNPAEVEIHPNGSVVIQGPRHWIGRFVRKWESWAWLTNAVEMEEAIQPDIEYAIRIRNGNEWLDCVCAFKRSYMHGERRELLRGVVCGYSRGGQVSTLQAGSYGVAAERSLQRKAGG